MNARIINISLLLLFTSLLGFNSAIAGNPGELHTDNFDYYGGITNGEPDGFGIASYHDGRKYTGYWNNGYKEGLGKIEYPDSTMDFGRWVRGRLSQTEGRAFTVGERVYGIDVSKYQRTINWSRLALPCSSRGLITKAGKYIQPVFFILVKSTQGTTLRNEFFKSQFEGAKEHGIVRGAYHFLSPNSSGKEQARYFIANTPLVSGDMPPVLDLEINRRTMARNHAKILRIAREWLTEIEKHYKVKPIIYTYDNYYRQYLHGHGFDDYEFWIANYSEEPRHRDCIIWQFADDGKALGIDHNVDLNRFCGGNYIDFISWLQTHSIPE